MRNNYYNTGLNTIPLDIDNSWASKTWDSPLYYTDNNRLPKGLNNQIDDKAISYNGDLNSNLFGGKVRQLFQERRGQLNRGRGWDRSHPLDPIKVSGRRGSSLDRLNENIDDKDINQNSYLKNRSAPPIDLDTSHLFRKLPNIGMEKSKLNNMSKNRPLSGKVIMDRKLPTGPNGTIKELDKSFSKLTTSKLSPTKKNNEPKSKLSQSSNVSSPSTKKPQSSNNKDIGGNEIRAKATTVIRVLTPTSRIPSPQKTNPSSPKVTSPVKKTKPVQEEVKKERVGPPPGSDFKECKMCGRYFAPDRIEKHEVICKKTKAKKRKVFDPVKHRLEGTEAESYLKKPQPKIDKSKEKLKKLDWRKKHNEFIATIRAAKDVQNHIAKGGKASDLPPPPPMDTSDLILCPHCGRKFSDAAAERHIPKCANISSNKPKSQTNRSIQKRR